MARFCGRLGWTMTALARSLVIASKAASSGSPHADHEGPKFDAQGLGCELVLFQE
jgi:hypothetical protein